MKKYASSSSSGLFVQKVLQNEHSYGSPTMNTAIISGKCNALYTKWKSN